MFKHRKIKTRGRFRQPPPDAVRACAESVAGADPDSCYTDCIPEDKALYKDVRAKRKAPSDSPLLSVREQTNWKKYRETRRISLQKLSQQRVEDSDGSSVSSDSGEGEDEDGDDDDEPGPEIQADVRHSLVRAPVKRKRSPSHADAMHLIDEMMRDFRLQDKTYMELMALLGSEMDKGLGRETNSHATVRMYPTYVRSTPDGSESGRFLALDLGGTNFRVLLVDLKGPDAPVTTSKVFYMPLVIMIGSGEMLFDHIAKCIEEFMTEHDLSGAALPMGFTFSFPCRQEGLASARLVRWTKGFSCSGVQGQDVGALLRKAICKRNDMQVECLAIINDPVGALMSAAHSDTHCKVGLILGTGTNCCYVEQLDNVELWDGDNEEPRTVIVNTEWGAFGDDGTLNYLRNAFDCELDRQSPNTGQQLFEKMISGMYMGELVRFVLCQLTADGLLFSGEGSDELFTPYRFYTKYISEIESDAPGSNYKNTMIVFHELDLGHATKDDCRRVQHVCWQVSQRAAFLAATAVACVVRRLDRSEVSIAVDGSLYRFHPHFHDLMHKKMRQLLPDKYQFRLTLAHDGSGKGAALVAAVAKRSRDKAAKQMDNS